MKVIKHGNRVKIHTCRECSCEFKYLPHDIITRTDDTFEEYYSIIKCIICPECQEEYYLSVNINGEDATDEWNK